MNGNIGLRTFASSGPFMIHCVRLTVVPNTKVHYTEKTGFPPRKGMFCIVFCFLTIDAVVVRMCWKWAHKTISKSQS